MKQVPPEGPQDARWAVIGEAPGYWEDRELRPFVGKSGQLLRESLNRVGLDPSQGWITNVVKERPPDNRTPTAAEIRESLPALIQELSGLPRLKAVLLVGGSALRAITGLTAITKHRGTVKSMREETKSLAHLDFFATLHPAAVLRNRNHEHSFLQDLAAFQQLVNGPAEEGEVILVRTEEDFDLFTEEFWAAESGAIDIETTVDESGKNDVELVSIAVTFDGKKAWVIAVTHPEAPKLEFPLQGFYDKVEWIMHNGYFDRMMLHKFGIDATLTHDTMAMAYLLHEQERKSLEVLSSVYLGLPPYKGVDYKNIMDEPLEKIALMNGRDAMRTFNLYRPLADELNQNTKLSRLYQWLLMPAINALIEITENGVPVDLARITALSQAVQAKLKVMATGLVMRAPKPVNPNSSQQVADLLFNHWELPILKTTEKGNPSVDADTRRQLIPKAPPEAAEFLEYLDEYKHLTTRSKHISNWLGLLDDNNHLHPRYKPLHVVTGRLSSESPNIQNVPRDPAYRGVFGGVPGHSWLKADLSQIELRLAAWIAKEPTMLRAYREGEDLHALTAEAVLGESEGPARQTGKTLNFGLLYGAGANTLERIARTEYGLILEPGQAAEYRDRFFKLYPRLGLWHRTMYKEVERDGISVSPMGRIRHLPDATYTGDDDDLRGKKYKAIREGINHPVQSFASDILLMSVVRLRERGLGPYMVAEVHDEIDFVVPDEMVEETKAEIENTMNDMEWLKRFGIELTVPVLTEVTIGTHWSEG